MLGPWNVWGQARPIQEGQGLPELRIKKVAGTPYNMITKGTLTRAEECLVWNITSTEEGGKVLCSFGWETGEIRY